MNPLTTILLHSLVLALLAAANLWHTVPLLPVRQKFSFKDGVTSAVLLIVFVLQIVLISGVPRE